MPTIPSIPSIPGIGGSNAAAQSLYGTGTLTFTGGLITDAVRTTGTEGDGLTPPAGVGIWPAATNLVTNGGFETNTTGYISSGSNSTVRSTVRSKFGTASALCTYGGALGSACAVYGITLTAAAYVGSAWVYVPTNYDGTALNLNFAGFTGASGVSTGVVNMALRDQWQRVTATITPAGGDLVGDLRLSAITSMPTPGNDFCFIDGVQVETGSIATPYIETDGGTASRTAGRVQQPVAGLITASQGWVATALSPGITASQIPTGAYIFSYYDDDNNRIDAYYDTQPAVILVRSALGVGNSDGIVEPAWNAGNILSVCQWSPTLLRTSIGGNFTVGTANTSIPTISSASVDIGTKAGVQFPIDGNVRWWATGIGALTNADAAALKTLGSTPPSSSQLRYALSAGAYPTSLWDGVDTSYIEYR